MIKNILIVLSVLNFCYLGLFLFFGLKTLLFGGLWIFIFIVGILFSSFTLFKYRKEPNSNVYLSIMVLAVSIGSSGTFGFTYLLSHLLG